MNEEELFALKLQNQFKTTKKRLTAVKHKANLEQDEMFLVVETTAGVLLSIQIPKSVEVALSEGDRIPSGFLSNLGIVSYLLAPAYKTYLTKTYGNKSSNMIARLKNHIEIFKKKSFLNEDKPRNNWSILDG